MQVSLRLICVVFIALSLLLFVDDCKGGKNKGGPGGGVAKVGKAIVQQGGKKGGLGKKVAVGAAVVGTGAAGYIAYKGIKKAVKHGRGDDDSSEEYYGRDRDYGRDYGRERNPYYGSGTRMSAWNPSFLLPAVVALGTIRW